MFEIILSLRIKYDDSRNQNNCDGWIKYWYVQGGHKTGRFTAAVCPTFPRQTNRN